MCFHQTLMFRRFVFEQQYIVFITPGGKRACRHLCHQTLASRHFGSTSALNKREAGELAGMSSHAVWAILCLVLVTWLVQPKTKYSSNKQ